MVARVIPGTHPGALTDAITEWMPSAPFKGEPGMVTDEQAAFFPTLVQVQERYSIFPRRGGVDYVFEHANRWWRCRFGPRCRTCQHEMLGEINRLLFLQVPAPDIIKSLGDKAGDLAPYNLIDHAKSHLPNRTWLAAANARRMADRIGVAIDDTMELVYSAEMLGHLVIEKVFVALSNGDLGVTVSDGFNAARFLAELELTRKVGVNAAAYADLMSAVLAVFRDTMTYDEFQSAMWSLGGNPHVQELIHVIDIEHGERVIRGQPMIEASAEEDVVEVVQEEDLPAPVDVLSWFSAH